MSLTLYNVIHLTAAIEIDGSQVASVITTPGQNATLTFSGTANQKVSFRCIGSTIAKTAVILVNPAGGYYFQPTIFTGEQLVAVHTLPSTATYTLELDPEMANTGTITMRLYDAASRLTSMTVAGQPTVNYTYDNANRLTQITQDTSTVTIGYDNADRRTSLTIPNGATTEYSYDNDSHLTGINYKKGATTLGNLTYTYDESGRRTKVGGSFARTELPSTISSSSYNAANHQTNFSGQTLTCDLNGNLTSDGVNTYEWNARDQLVSISGPGSAPHSNMMLSGEESPELSTALLPASFTTVRILCRRSQARRSRPTCSPGVSMNSSCALTRLVRPLVPCTTLAQCGIRSGSHYRVCQLSVIDSFAACGLSPPQTVSASSRLLSLHSCRCFAVSAVILRHSAHISALLLRFLLAQAPLSSHRRLRVPYHQVRRE